MPYALRKLPEAGAEAKDAAAWYEERHPGLGFDFLAQVDRAIESVVQNPFRHAIRFGDVRRAPVRRFKFNGIYYFVLAEDVIIISVFNDRQDPAKLRQRRSRVP